MPVALSSLVDQLESDVPPMHGTPTGAQYTQAVKDAIADLGRRAPMQKLTTIAILSGTATYALPADFLKLIRLTSLAAPQGVLITDAGLIPVSQRSCERWLINGLYITFYPTPAYTLERGLWYAAAYALDGDDYDNLTDDRAQIAMLKARSLALNLQANKAAPLSMRLKSGDDDADRTKIVATLRETAEEWKTEYLTAVVRLVGAVGVRG